MIKNIILLIMTIFLLSGCFGEKKEEKWTVFIYPNKNDQKKNIKSPMTFSTLSECEKVALFEIKNQKLDDIASFKCGLNCNYHEGMKLEVCEKMITSTEKQ